jgi:hypothetical protein
MPNIRAQNWPWRQPSDLEQPADAQPDQRGSAQRLNFKRCLKATLLGVLGVGTPTLLGIWRCRQPAALPTALTSGISCRPHASMPTCPPSIVPAVPLSANLAVCMISRDEEDMVEWLTHHRKLGVGAFYLFDHNSTIPMTQTVPYSALSRGDVHYQYINHVEPGYAENPQMAVYRECLENYGDRHDWFALIDADEYLMPSLDYLHLPTFLLRFEGHCALTLNWRVIGSSNHTHRPSGGVIENYTNCYEKDDRFHLFVKYIVNPKMLDHMVNPHTVACRDGSKPMTENVEHFGGPDIHPINTDKVGLYHYILKSREEFERKHQRGGGTGDIRPREFFDEVDAKATHTCLRAQELAKVLQVTEL